VVTFRPQPLGSNSASKAGRCLPVRWKPDDKNARLLGPCPPAGDKPHRYIFTVHALKVDKLDLTADASAAMVGFMTHMNTLGNASFTARYGR
jgi:phosphatidylethanolamine-binding protein (PEBP) family uncharacterized protein